MQSFHFRKITLFDLILFLLAISLLLIWGRQFGAIFFTMVIAVVLVLRRIDFSKHQLLRRIVTTGFVLLGASFLIIEGLVVSEMNSNAVGENDTDYIIVLGSGLKNGDQLSNTLKLRLDTALQYASVHTDIPMIVSGGQGPDEELSEALAMRNYLISQGIPEERIILEDQSTSTEENLNYSKAIIQGAGVTIPRIVLVTSDYHMYRAKLLASREGFHAAGLAADSPIRQKPISMVREYFAMVKTLLL